MPYLLFFYFPVAKFIFIRIQEHRYYNKLKQKYHESGNGWTFVSASVKKSSVNVAAGSVVMLLSRRVLKSLYSIDKLQLRILFATFNDIPCPIIISCHSTNVNDERNIIIFYNELFSLV